jgi:hypothetical protein
VTTREKPFLEMDAGKQREFLTQALADWIDAGFWSLPRSTAFHRRMTILARRIGMGRVELLDQIRADVDAIGAARTGRMGGHHG